MTELRQHQLTTAPGVTVAVDDAGPLDAPALVFLHGIAQSRRAFTELLATPPVALAGFRRVALDMRGHGDGASATLTPEQLTPAALAEDVWQTIASLTLHTPVLVPWSYGGVVASAMLADDRASTLRGVLACAAALRTGRAGKGLYGPAMLDNGKAMVGDDNEAYQAACPGFVDGCSVAPVPEPLRETLIGEMRRVPLLVRRALLGVMVDEVSRWVDTQVPVGFIHGADDAVVRPGMSEAVVAVRPDTILTLLPGVGHMPWVEAPAAFASAVAARAASW